MSTERRKFLAGLGAAGLAACTRPAEPPQAAPSGQARSKTYKWKMVTTWPPNFPGLGTGAVNLARLIEKASGGRIRIQVYAGGELIPAFEVFDAVSSGTAEMGHGAAYYWKGKIAAAQLFAAVPFGMTIQELNAWLYYGGGLELWRDLYAPFDLIPTPAGSTGVQMGGWFNKEIHSMKDLDGLKMRIPGLGGEVLKRAGGLTVTIPGSEIFTALQTGNIDATEWVGPYNDLAFGLHQAAKYYYYPGWHEPGPVLECILNKQAFESLPEDLKAIVMVACQAINTDMLAEFTARNHEALDTLVNEHKVELRQFPDEVLSRIKQLSTQVMEELAAGDEAVRPIYESYRAFLDKVSVWHRISEQAILESRQL